MCHYKWHFVDFSHNCSMKISSKVDESPSHNVSATPLKSVCCLVLSCSLNLSLFLLFMSLKFHSGHMFWRRHAYSDTHTQTHSYSWACVLIVSICSLWCCAAALLLTNWPFHRGSATRPKQSPPQLGRLQSITHTSYAHTNTQWPLQSQS